jgi:hypothetical protein
MIRLGFDHQIIDGAVIQPHKPGVPAAQETRAIGAEFGIGAGQGFVQFPCFLFGHFRHISIRGIKTQEPLCKGPGIGV